MSNDYYRRYLEYIRNAGGRVSFAAFDEDWEPIGGGIRSELFMKGLVAFSEGTVTLTDAGEAMIR